MCIRKGISSSAYREEKEDPPPSFSRVKKEGEGAGGACRLPGRARRRRSSARDRPKKKQAGVCPSLLSLECASTSRCRGAAQILLPRRVWTSTNRKKKTNEKTNKQAERRPRGGGRSRVLAARGVESLLFFSLFVAVVPGVVSAGEGDRGAALVDRSPE